MVSVIDDGPYSLSRPFFKDHSEAEKNIKTMILNADFDSYYYNADSLIYSSYEEGDNTLEYIDMSQTHYTVLPKAFVKSKNRKVVHLSDNLNSLMRQSFSG